MAKLIRDLIPDDMRARGYEPKLTNVQGPHLIGWLWEKLDEETDEAWADEGSLAELSDVYEVFRSLVEAKGLTMAQIIAAANDKAARLGRFTKGIVWLNDKDKSDHALRARAGYQQAEAQR